MEKHIMWGALDTSKKRLAGAVLPSSSWEVEEVVVADERRAVERRARRLVQEAPGPVRVCHEAAPEQSRRGEWCCRWGGPPRGRIVTRPAEFCGPHHRESFRELITWLAFGVEIQFNAAGITPGCEPITPRAPGMDASAGVTAPVEKGGEGPS